MGVNQSSRNPGLVGNAVRIQLTSSNERLLATAINLIAIYVQIINRIKSKEAFIESKPIAHFIDVQKPSIREWFSIGSNRGIREVASSNRNHFNVVNANSCLSCLDI